MAEKKSEAKAVKAPAKEKMVTVKLPRLKGDNEAMYVSVNERNWLIPRGVEVEIPECAALIIQQAEEAEEAAFAYENKITK